MVMYHHWPNVPAFVYMWVSCASVGRIVIYQGYFPWRGQGGVVEIKFIVQMCVGQQSWVQP